MNVALTEPGPGRCMWLGSVTGSSGSGWMGHDSTPAVGDDVVLIDLKWVYFFAMNLTTPI